MRHAAWLAALLLSAQAGCALRLDVDLFPHADFLHIAKTGGKSLSWDLGKHMNNLKLRWPFSGEHCYGALDSETIVTFLRQPRSHVYSQWLHCSQNLNNWFAPINLPGNMSEWLQHWVRTGDKPQRAQTFRCYHPMNLQSRTLSCNNSVWNLPCASPAVDTYVLGDDKEEFEENVELAKRRLKSMHFVGITEFYQESLCALHVREKHEFPDYCNCESEAWNHAPTRHMRHGARAHGRAEVDVKDDDLDLIDRLTVHDQALYELGLQRLRRDISEVEESYGKKIWCHDETVSTSKSKPLAAKQGSTIALYSWDQGPDAEVESNARVLNSKRVNGICKEEKLVEA